MVTHMESYGIRGADAYRVTVETDISGGLPGFILVGYLAESVREAQERVRTALRNSGISLPPKKITVNLSPAGIRKSGTAFDLAITAGILACLALVPEREAGRYTYIGELGLDGQVKPVSGVLPRVAAAVEQGRPRVFVPREMLPEASLVRGAEAVGVGSILELMEFLRHPEKAVPAEFDPAAFLPPEDEGGPDFADLFGLPMVRLASEAAAAGKHHILYIGPAGTGKTMAASRLPSILPPLAPEESLAVTRIYSICGLLDPGNPLIRRRPFRSPHHSVTAPALIGGGMRALPGETVPGVRRRSLSRRTPGIPPGHPGYAPAGAGEPETHHFPAFLPGRLSGGCPPCLRDEPVPVRVLSGSRPVSLYACPAEKLSWADFRPVS